jgi:glycosyltransferase involved in cell wall biosynthesis
MRILFSAQFFLNGSGGAELCARTLMKKLAQTHEVHVVSAGGQGDYDWEGIRVHEVKKCPNNILYINLFWSRYLINLGFKPDLVITQMNAAAPTTLWAKFHGIPSIFYAHGFEHFCLESFNYGDVFTCRQRCWRCGGLRKFMLHPLYHVIFDRNRRAILAAGLVIAPSAFMQKVVRHYSGRDADIVPNPLDLDKYRVKPEGGSILFVKPLKHKGVGLVADLVNRMKNRRFVLTGEIDRDYAWLKDEPNVEYLGEVKDMKTAYGKAKIVLVPSTMAESFSRVVLEAMVSGIPVITSDNGGPAETGGDASIKLSVNEPEKWIDAIERLYKDGDFWAKKSRECRENAARYSLEMSLNIFDEALYKRLNIRLLNRPG